MIKKSENMIINKFKDNFENKKIAIWGLGREGKSTINFFNTHNVKIKELGLLDSKEITLSNLNVENISNIKILDKEDDLNNYDIIFKSPGIVVKNTNIDITKLTSQTEEFIKAFSNQIIGITGTKGKSTTSSLIYTILKKYYPNTILVGNIGIPCWGMLDEIDEDTKIIFELSCHQLEFINCSPHISVILNLYPEHLDHYITFEKYIAAKLNITNYQNKNDYLIYGKTVENYLKNTISKKINMNNYIKDRTIQISQNDKITIKKDETHLLGEHNLFNIGIAYYICHNLYNISEKQFKSGLKDFNGLPHRLEYVATKNNVKYYDDSISTIGETTIEGVKALTCVNTLILGGMDRGIDYSDLINFLINEHLVKNIILMPNTGYRIYDELKSKIKNSNSLTFIEENNQSKLIGKSTKFFYKVKDLNDAVQKAYLITEPHTNCLLSPAAASYGFFKNFEERGDKFKELVQNL